MNGGGHICGAMTGTDETGAQAVAFFNADV